MIQFAVTPGATAFRPGDTITVSGSEVYEIIRVRYSTNQLGLDNIDNNTSKGIAFCEDNLMANFNLGLSSAVFLEVQQEHFNQLQQTL